MINKTIFIFALTIFSSYAANQKGWKELNFKESKISISIPNQWNYIKYYEDHPSVGKIVGNHFLLYCNTSAIKFADHLKPGEKEYLNGKEWLYVPSYLEGTGADKNNVIIKRISKPVGSQQKDFPGADYIAELTHKGSPFFIGITIPIEAKTHFIKIDSTGNYVIKTFWPKVAGKGVTGIDIKFIKYINGSSSVFNFQMHGKNLSSTNQELALKAFKTITFKQ